jgi:deoxyribodipyrimidine photolyase-related protein
MNTVLVLGNQLFDPTKNLSKVNKKTTVIFMREDAELCQYYKFHKHKIIFFLSAMRAYANDLEKKGFLVHYEKLNSTAFKSYEEALKAFLKKQKSETLYNFEIEDKFFEKRINTLTAELKIKQETWQSPMFLTPRPLFKESISQHKRPFMKNFYELQRKRLKILVDKNNKPSGGQWSFDKDNRKALPLSIHPPEIKIPKLKKEIIEVSQIVENEFPSHPGESKNFWLPVDREGARSWLNDFLNDRLSSFGPFEDALPTHSDFVFHSVLTPFLNTGLLTPDEVVEQTLIFAKKNKTPLGSVEGFIRQIIGWREFIRGIYQNFSEKQESSNFWKHEKKLTTHWYTGETGIPPLDATLKKVIRYGYCHHIERLMVLGSLMLLLEIHPQEAHRWFMEMFVDSSDWVMGPNVYGMALFSDGGIFATKPYFCGSNYYMKMGPFKKDKNSSSWSDGVDGLYWQFIEKHKSFFLKNPRLSMMARSVEKMKADRKKIIFCEADKLRKKLTSLMYSEKSYYFHK